MMLNTYSNLYPDFAFPPIANALIQEIANETKAPISMVGGSVLAAMALAVQGQYRVKRMHGLESPCALAIVTICASGERKTTVDNKTSRAFREFESEKSVEFEELHADYRAKKMIWDARKRVLTRQFEKAAESGAPLEHFPELITEQDRYEPKHPRRIRFVYKDATPASLLHGLHKNTRSASLNEDEAARFFDGPLTNDACLINKGWDGSDLIVDRRTSESFAVNSPRISLNLMVQPAAFAKYMERKGHEARGVGFIARWLVCYPMTTQGTRFDNYTELPEPLAQRSFNDRVKELLNQQLMTGAIECSLFETVLTFSPDAQFEWLNISNQVEASIRPGGDFCDASDYASKIAENIARIAGVFHAFSGQEGTQISLETVRSAVMVASWYANEFKRLFSPPDPIAESVRDAILLESWLIRLVQTRGWHCLEKNFILQFGPNALRNRDRLHWSLEYLAQTQRLWIQPAGKRKKIVCLNDNFFGQIARGMPPIGFSPL